MRRFFFWGAGVYGKLAVVAPSSVGFADTFPPRGRLGGQRQRHPAKNEQLVEPVPLG